MAKKAAQNKSKTPIAIAISIVTIVVIAIIFMIIYKSTARFGNYRIPEGYIDSTVVDRSATDGPKTTYYIYDNEIIAESIQSVPDGHQCNCTRIRTITCYSTSDINKIDQVQDRTIAEEYQ